MNTYQVMPDLAPEDFSALKADIAERGVLVPVEYDEDGNILDGHHRVEACEQLGLSDWPRFVRKGLSEAEKRQHARQLNLARRHLNREQKRGLISEQLRETPEKSNRQVAYGLGVSHPTVANVRRELEESGDVEKLTTSIDTLGRQQPARKPMRTEFRDPSPDTTSGVPRKAFVTNNSGKNEWYTPAYIIEAARSVLGEIELDPATSEIANETVRATEYYTESDNALSLDWPRSKIWMNPPYARGLVADFVAKVTESVEAGSEAIVLVNNASETGWFQSLAGVCSAVCFHKGRVRYATPEGDDSGAPLQGQAIFYCGPDAEKFRREFGELGVVLCRQP